MFLKAADKKDKTTGKIYRYFKLCQSYRIGDKTRHNTILVLGKLQEIETDAERKMLADRIDQLLTGGQSLFASQIPPNVEKLAQYFYRQINHKHLTEQPVAQAETKRKATRDKDFQHVDLSSIIMEDVREIGCEWLCKQALEELSVGEFLKQCSWDETQTERALMHIISRATYPASEHKTAQ